jgi:predicted nucleic acid-binding protein
MNLVDSSGWLEYFVDSKYAKHFAPAIEKINELIVSTINIFEVYKKILTQVDDYHALQAVAIMQQGKVFEVSTEISIQAAKLSFELKIPMADSIIYVTAQKNNALLWTMDSDFKELKDVNFFNKK